MLEVEPAGVDRFDGRSPQTAWGRVFGGLVVAQALVAAARTVDRRPSHSLHAYFILPGDPAATISYAVERIRDGKSFSVRRCVASQNGQAIFALSASFQTEEAGFAHQSSMPDVPPPEDLPTEAELAQKLAGLIPETVLRFLTRDRPVEIRPTNLKQYYGVSAAAGSDAAQNIWIRVKQTLPDDAAVHRAALAYLSDMTLINAALVPHGTTVFDPSVQVASLDHALWFHRPFRADEWLLYSQESPSASGARGLARGLIYSKAGVLVASVAQEGLIRLRQTRASQAPAVT